MLWDITSMGNCFSSSDDRVPTDRQAAQVYYTRQILHNPRTHRNYPPRPPKSTYGTLHKSLSRDLDIANNVNGEVTDNRGGN